MIKLRNSIVIIIFWTVLGGVVSASEGTFLFRLRNPGERFHKSLYAGNKVLGHSGTVENLMNAATFSQSDFISVLESDTRITSYHRYWIANIVKVTGDSAFLASLSQRADVEEVFEDLPVELIAPVEAHEDMIADIGHTTGAEAIHAPEAWELGLDGSGSLVCSFDTGVNGDHPGLSSKFRGNNGGNQGACWFDPYSNTEYPSDNNGHGTHTMGTMVGSEAGDTVGVAPGAQWIAAGVVDRGGGINRTISDLLAAFEWAADPDGDPMTVDDVPDVVNNSWGIPMGYYPSCEATFWEAIDNLEAAGVVCVFAAGNEGPNPGTMRIPADRIGSEFNTFSVGAVDGGSPDLPVAGFSSRGPSGCDHLTIKPEVMAPGVAVRSTSRTGGYALMSGTSMAAPHVAGAVAILRQFNPQATPDEIKMALMNSALDLGQPGEDNDYGRGMINVRRALDLMPTPSDPYPVITGTNISGFPLPGGNFHMQVTVFNLGGGAADVNAHLSSPDQNAGILSGDVTISSMRQGDTIPLDGWDIHFSNELQLGDRVRFNLALINNDLTINREFLIAVGDLSTPVADQSNLPNSSLIVINYPNPFNSSTLIQLRGPNNPTGTMMIFDSCGRLVKKLSLSGNRTVWDGTDLSCIPVAAGIYFARIEGELFAARKMILIK